MTRILIRRKGALGDVISTTPVATRLRRENPDAEIHVDTYYWAVYAQNPHVNGPYDPNLRYDRVVDLDLYYERNRRVKHVEALMLAAFGDDGAESGGDREIVVTYPSSPVVDGPYVAIHPARSWASRTFSREFWQAVVDELLAAGHRVAVTGTAMDAELRGVIDTRNQLALHHQATLISQARAFLCSDSGMYLLSCATPVPIVALLTITAAEINEPYRRGRFGWNFFPLRTDLECYGCASEEPPSTFFTCRRGDNACVSSFDPKAVAARVNEAIEHDERRGS